jgi:hypothetical protein
MLDAGGWSAKTLTEDLDLSYRAFLRGWRAVYVASVVARAELPASFNAYRRQQSRWARGSLQCAASLLPRVWAAAAPFGRRFQATLHLTGYGVHLLMLALALLYPALLFYSTRYEGLLSLFGIGPIFNLTALAPAAMFATAQRRVGRPWRRAVGIALLATLAGSGLMANTARAAVLAFTAGGGAFLRTPKAGGDPASTRFVGYGALADPLIVVEIALALYCAATCAYALALANWVVAFYSGVFALSLAFAVGQSLAHAVRPSLRPASRLAHGQGGATP